MPKHIQILPHEKTIALPKCHEESSRAKTQDITNVGAVPLKPSQGKSSRWVAQITTNVLK